MVREVVALEQARVAVETEAEAERRRGWRG